MLRTSLFLLALMGASSLAVAQTAADSGPKVMGKVVVAESEEPLEQVTSSGALGSKSILDTPFSLTVIGADEIEQRQVNSIGQMFFNDPSISSAAPSATTNWWGAQIRGLPVRNYYVDGVPLLLYWGGDYPLEPIQSVEALKGLTGFMYGFGTPGGAISYSTKRPGEEKKTSLSLEYRNAGVFGANVDTTGRLGDTGFGYRVNLAGEYGEAYSTADVNRNLASLALDYRFSPNLQWFANAVYEDSNLKHEPIYFYWDMFEGERLPRATYDYDNVAIDDSFYKTETLNAATGLEWRLNDQWSSKLIVGYSEKEHLSNKMFAYILNEEGDYEGNAYNFAGLLKNYFSQGLVQGEFTTGAIRHEVVFGAEYQRATGQWGNDWYWSNDFNGNLYQPQDFVNDRDIDFSLAPISEDVRQKALFASDTLHFGEHWQTMLGLRYTDYDLLDRDGDPEFDSGYATDRVSPTVAVIFKPDVTTSIYASFVEALESGSRVGETYANFGEVLDATVSKQYEIGMKMVRERVEFSTAAFRVERGAEIDQFIDGLRYLTQDGLTMYDGIEGSVSFAATENLNLGFGATWLDAGIDQVSPENADIEGNVPAGAAEWQVLANIKYDVSAVPGLRVFGTARYFDDAYYEDANVVLIPSRTLLNVGLQYDLDIAGRPAKITANIYNLLNEKYWELNQLGEGVNGSLGLKLSW